MNLFRRRAIILFALVMLAGCVVLTRLAVIQASGHRTFDRSRYARVGGDRTVETVRGGVYTRWGTPLAEQVPSFALGVHYGDLSEDTWIQTAHTLCGADPERLAERAGQIARDVERMRQAVRERLDDPRLHVREEYEYHSVVDDVPPDVAALVRTDPARFAGMKILERTRRQYPNGTLAPHIVGRVRRIDEETWRHIMEQGRHWQPGMGLANIGARYRMDDTIGVSGIEKQYERLLRGARGHVINRLSIGVLKVATHCEETPPQRGADVFLTLREDFQRAANAALARAATTPELDFHAGALVIIEVNSGAVLAAASWPSYDLSRYARDYERIVRREHSPLVYRPIHGAYQPGSAFKVITAIAALETDAIDEHTTYVCQQHIGLGGRTFRCEGHHGQMTVVPAIEHSCNIFFYRTGLAAGGEALARYGRMFGLGLATHGRSDPLVPPTSMHGVVNLSIGQGPLDVSPLQIANMMAVVANGGRLYEPHFFHRAVSVEGDTIETYQPAWREIRLKPGTLALVREGLRRVVETGTARHADLGEYRASGKTGTAQTNRHRTDAEGRRIALYHAWFAGYAPREDPKIAFAVVSEDTAGHGGSHAAPIVADVLWQIWQDVEDMPAERHGGG